jgi:hypothetical protein
MSNPRPANTPGTCDCKVGSFWTRQLRTCLVYMSRQPHADSQERQTREKAGKSRNIENENKNKNVLKRCSPFVRHPAGGRHVIEDVHDLLCGPGPRKVHLWESLGPDLVRYLVFEGRHRVVDQRRGLGGVLIDCMHAVVDSPCVGGRAPETTHTEQRAFLKRFCAQCEEGAHCETKFASAGA